MIFVTVGTHEQPFDRLIEAVDKLKKNGIITEEVIMQTGFGTYEPKYCTFSKLFPYEEMIKKVEAARIVITHGGPASFIMPLQMGKMPIVVPRQKKFGEHVNDHQVEFARAVAERMGTIIVVEDVSTLGDVICEYEECCRKLRDSCIAGSPAGNLAGRIPENQIVGLAKKTTEIENQVKSLEENQTGNFTKGMGNNRGFNERLEEIVRELGVE